MVDVWKVVKLNKSFISFKIIKIGVQQLLNSEQGENGKREEMGRENYRAELCFFQDVEKFVILFDYVDKFFLRYFTVTILV